jgi:glycosyltransferase involved in cell wall biosynthesis
MYKYKVCVYAICKNEEQFVDKWYESVKEVDKIYVLDTGSTDNTMKLLESKDKVVVKQQVITPWRFDVARNLSLDMVPQDTDICVCIDFDEILSKG